MVLKNTGGVVKWYIALFIVFFFIFAHTLYLMIGAVSESFCSLWSSYYSTLVTVIGTFNILCVLPISFQYSKSQLAFFQ